MIIERMSQKVRLPVKPFKQWLETLYPELPISELQYYVGMDERTLRAVLSGEREYVTLRVVDSVTTHVGMPHMLNELYPLEEHQT